MIKGTKQRQYLASYLNEIASTIHVNVVSAVQLPTKGRTPSTSSPATLMNHEDAFQLVAVEYDEDAQGGRGDFKLTLKPIATQVYVSAEASVNAHGHALRLMVDGQSDTFEGSCDVLLNKELKPGVTALRAIEYHIQSARDKELAENRQLNADYGTW